MLHVLCPDSTMNLAEAANQAKDEFLAEVSHELSQ
jgi:signal transduction histidine kinase